MELTPALMEPLFIHNSAAALLPGGIVGWADTGALLVWFVLVAFVGSLFGILRERTRQNRRTKAIGRPGLADRRAEQPA